MTSLLKDVGIAIFTICSLFGILLFWLAIFFFISAVVSLPIYVAWHILAQIGVNVPQPLWRTAMGIAMIIVALKSTLE